MGWEKSFSYCCIIIKECNIMSSERNFSFASLSKQISRWKYVCESTEKNAIEKISLSRTKLLFYHFAAVFTAQVNSFEQIFLRICWHREQDVEKLKIISCAAGEPFVLILCASVYDDEYIKCMSAMMMCSAAIVKFFHSLRRFFQLIFLFPQ